MKKRELFIKKSLFTSLILILFISCATTNENSKKSSSSSKANSVEEITAPQPTEEELFIEAINKYSISFTKVPAKTTKGKEFSSDFEVTVLDQEGNPSADFAVCFDYPSEKTGSQYTRSTKIIKTNENGIAAFNPGTVNFAADQVVTAYPEITVELSQDYESLPLPMAKAPFLVESDVAKKGAIMFVFEYTESGKPSKNSYEILSGLRKKGVSQIGNAPISDTDYINASKEKIYKENFSYVGTDFGYLIGGTIKFTGPVEQTEDGYIARLCAEIYGIDMKTGEVIYENTHNVEASGSNWNYAVSNCRDKLTPIVVDSIMLGL